MRIGIHSLKMVVEIPGVDYLWLEESLLKALASGSA